MADPQMFDRYTDRARRVLAIAQDEARNLGHAGIGSGHLLLGLIGEDEGVAAVVLKSLGATLEDARRTVGRGTTPHLTGIPAGPLQFTPILAKVLEQAAREAVLLAHNFIATEHLLLGLVAGSSPGVSSLAAIGVGPAEARAKVMALLHGYGEVGKSPLTPDLAAAPAAVGPLAALEEIRGRERQATPGPWWFDEDDEVWRLHGVADAIAPQLDGLIPEQVINHQIIKAPKQGTPYAEYWPNAADAAFIVAARTDVPRLLAALDEVLKLAGEAKPAGWDFGPDGMHAPVSWDLDPAAIRDAVTRELTGEGNDGD